MNTRWATGTDVRPDVLEELQGNLTVSTIMTSREDLETCRRDETAREVMARNEARYSVLPVVDGTERERFIGLYRAERWFGKKAPDCPIHDDYEALSEDHLIGADAGVIDFVATADERQARLVVSESEVAGLVTLSDLQQLPVRAAIFTLLTSLEIAMAQRIETEWPDNPGEWLEKLSERRRRKVLDKVETAKREDLFVSEIAFTQISDKATILLKSKLVSGSRTQLERDFGGIRQLRDAVAHANYYAETPEDAQRTCRTIRTIGRIQRDLLQGSSGHQH